MKTYCLTLDLKNSPELIEEYKRYHRRDVIWPEVLDAICGHGILKEEIYLLGNRLVMVLTTTDEFSVEAKADAHRVNPKMQEWETLMWRFQQQLPGSKPGEKWMLMERIFSVDIETAVPPGH